MNPKTRKIIFRLNTLFLFFFSLALIVLSKTTVHSIEDKKINFFITGVNNEVGIGLDKKILKEALENLGHHVIVDQPNQNFSNDPNSANIDINIFLQRIIKDNIPNAKLNWFIPNPEWYQQPLSFLEDIDLVLCRTHEIERIFKDLHPNVYQLGFTSQDIHSNEIEKDFNKYLHLAGKSIHKATNKVVELWNQNLLLPHLNLVISRTNKFSLTNPNVSWINHWIPLEDLNKIQHSCGIHICPSEVEGYGHYIVEAMSMGAVIITTNAPPMNEFITDPRCLIPYEKTASRYLGTCYYISTEALKDTIENIRTLSDAELQEIGEQNKALFWKKRQEFYDNLKALIDNLTL